MAKIYKNQTALTIELTTGVSLSGATAKIKYKKPDGSEDFWDATITDEDNGVIEYAIESENDLDQSGIWVFWAYITFSDNTVAPGEPVSQGVFEQSK